MTKFMGWLDIFKKGESGVRTPKKNKPEYKPFEVVKSEKGDYNEFLGKVKRSSLIMLIIGKRGSGKTALGMKYLELYHNLSKRKCYALGFEKTRLPFWLKKVNEMEQIPNNAVVLFDEGAVLFSSRDSMKNLNKELGKIMAIARHKNLTLILITQNSAMIDLNVLRLSDTILLKEPSLMQAKFERKAMKDMYEKVKPDFEELKDKKAHFFVWDDDFMGILNYSLPEFWSEKISTSFKNY